MSFLLSLVSNLGLGIALAFAYSWPIALCTIGFLPLMIISAVLQSKLLTGFSKKDKQNLEDAGKACGLLKLSSNHFDSDNKSFELLSMNRKDCQ